MKKLSFVLFAISLLVPASALGQDTSKPDTTTPNNLKSQRASTKALKLSGKVGEDGKTLTTDKNYLWTVTNPDILKDHAGKQVKVKCQISSDPAIKEIRVLSVKMIQNEIKYVANKGDAAFRR
jgi:hypothetical protein